MSRNIYLDLPRGLGEIVERSRKISKHAVSVRTSHREGLLARQPLAHVRVAAQYGCIRWQVLHRRQQAHIGAMAFSILDKELRDRTEVARIPVARHAPVEDDDAIEGAGIWKLRD